jgi:glycosyltransferase involved in cell wall biosynthesis
MNVGVLIIGMGNLSGAGGAERFYADLFEAYNSQVNPKRKLFYISDDLSPLRKINKLKSFPENQLTFTSYHYRLFHRITKNRPRIDKWMNNFRAYLTMKSLIKQLKRQNVTMLQLPVYEDKDFYLLKALDDLPLIERPKLILNVTNAVVQNHYFDDNPRYAYHSKLNYGRLFENVKLDGVYTWYAAFKKFTEKEKVIKSNPIIHNVATRFTSTEFHEDFTNRENKIIYSGRLSEYKDPMLFVKAAEEVYKRIPNNGWKFEMYGKGGLEKEVKDYIEHHQLDNFLSLNFSPDMPSVLKKSKIYVSTQNVENFPSLAMAEAMACCNVIVARNVGQTNLYVKHNINGFLIETGNPEELADKLLDIINKPNSFIETMGKESISLLKNVHNKENFIKEIDEFWDTIKNNKE